MTRRRSPTVLPSVASCFLLLSWPLLLLGSDEVNRLFKNYKENRDMVHSIGSQYYITYPIQIRQSRRQATLNTRENGPIKLERDGTASRNGFYQKDSTRHVEKTSIIIKAFSHQFQVDLQLNSQLLAPNLIHKHYLANGAEQISKQEIEHCYYHGTVRDYPGAVAAMRTCNGVSGVIQIGNETFVIHPFYGGDMSMQHPHLVYESRSPVQQACANTRLYELGLRNYRDTRGRHVRSDWWNSNQKSPYRLERSNPRAINRSTSHLSRAVDRSNHRLLEFNPTSSFASWAVHSARHPHEPPVSSGHASSSSWKRRRVRDVRSVTKHMELALVLDKAMFDIRNASTRESVIHDAIQVVNIADQYYKTLNTRISLVYIETWSAQNQVSVNPSDEIRHALLNFKEYGSRHMYKISRDTTHLLSGVRFKFGKTGMAVPGQICNDNSYGVTVDSSIYEPHVTASTMAHVLGHVIGMAHDDREGCTCSDWHGCIMAASIVGKDSVQPYKFSQCSREDYVKELQRTHGLCLFNRPNELRMRNCGNGIVEEEEDCDCGTVDATECERMDPCCDHITCKLRTEAECSTGPCCHNCRLQPRGTLCRKAATECDVPEFCAGNTGTCPMDVHKKNGQLCAGGEGYCFRGICPTRNQQCTQIWGYDSVASDDQCYQRFNTQGFINGHCGKDNMGRFVKCVQENVLCGLLQCQLGYPNPVLSSGADDDDQTVSRTVISVRGQEFHCNVASGNMNPLRKPDQGMVLDGTRCGDNMICVNHTCSALYPHVDQGRCPSNGTHECSGKGVCTNLNSCYCFAGYAGASCALRSNTTYPRAEVVPPQSPTGTTTSKPKKRILDTIDTNARTTSLVKSGGSSTLHLVIALVSLVGMIFIFFTFVALCYRRRSTLPKYGINLNKNSNPPKSMSLNSRNRASGSAEELEASRMITFGSMPSYSASFPREHKMTQQRPLPYGANQRSYGATPPGAQQMAPGSHQMPPGAHQMPPVTAAGAGTGSRMHLAAAAQMAPLPSHPSMPLMTSPPIIPLGHRSRTRPHMLTTRPIDQLDDEDGFLPSRPSSQPKTPERGILKKASSGAIYGSVGGGDRWPDDSHSDNNDAHSVSDNNPDSDTNGQVTEVERTLKSLNGYHEDILEALRNAAGARGSSSASYSDERRSEFSAGVLLARYRRPESTSCGAAEKLSVTSEGTSQPFTDESTAFTGETESDDMLERALVRANLAAVAAAAMAGSTHIKPHTLSSPPSEDSDPFPH